MGVCIVSSVAEMKGLFIEVHLHLPIVDRGTLALFILDCRLFVA